MIKRCQRFIARFPFLKELGGLNIFFLLAAIFAASAGIYLQRQAFPATGASYKQISAAVYVEKVPAAVSLTATFSPARVKNFDLQISVRGPKGQPDPWLLVIQCAPPQGQEAPPTVTLWSEIGAGAQKVGPVLATVHLRPSWHHQFACDTGLSDHGQSASAAINGRDINLALPVLQQPALSQSPDVQPDQGSLRLSVESSKFGTHGIEKIVAVQQAPGLSCPPQGTSPDQAGSSSAQPASSQPTPISPSGGTPSTSASAPVASSSATPAPSASSASIPNTGSCYTQVSPAAEVTGYSLPNSVQAKETLEGVSLKDDRIDSLFPQGQVLNNKVIWQESSGLSPGLNATNLASAASQTKAAFWAGLLYGVAAALAVPFLQEVHKAKAARKKPANDPAGPGKASAAEGRG